MIKKIIVALRLFGAVFAGVNMFTETSGEDVSSVVVGAVKDRGVENGGGGGV